ncbi:hypothetical protein [Streptomyces herbicida]|uniref:hypothetical protein n=1 Tax=Streptomyces herbicida TaxID=3065675 RepID=UPI00292F21FB|nr:hypothetical protein [Streptomyces sp. NEAU-HV9]
MAGEVEVRPPGSEADDDGDKTDGKGERAGRHIDQPVDNARHGFSEPDRPTQRLAEHRVAVVEAARRITAPDAATSRTRAQLPDVIVGGAERRLALAPRRPARRAAHSRTADTPA